MRDRRHCAEQRDGGQERPAFYQLNKRQAQGEPLRAMQMATQNVNTCGVGKLVQGEPLQYYLAAVEMHELQRVTLMCADYFFSLHTSLCTRLCHRSSVEPQGRLYTGPGFLFQVIMQGEPLQMAKKPRHHYMQGEPLQMARLT